MSKKSLNKRYDHSEKTKDSSGGSMAFNFPGDTKYYKPKEGNNEIDIIPYVVKTKNHPLVKTGEMKIGDWDYVMDVWVHRSIGPGNIDVICLKKNFRKACPVCELAEGFKKDGKDEDYKSVKASRRVYYNVIDVDGDDDEIKIFGTSHYLFEKEMIEEARASVKGGDMVDFADIDEGSTVACRGSKTSIGGNEFIKYKSFKFLERDYSYTEDDVKDAFSFDEFMIIYSAEEITRIIYGEEEEENKSESPVPEETEKKEEKTSRRKRGRKRSVPEETEKKEEKTSRRGRKNNSKSEDKCPSGHVFGEDVDDYKDCDNCEVWDDCSAEAEGK